MFINDMIPDRVLLPIRDTKKDRLINCDKAVFLLTYSLKIGNLIRSQDQ